MAIGDPGGVGGGGSSGNGNGGESRDFGYGPGDNPGRGNNPGRGAAPGVGDQTGGAGQDEGWDSPGGAFASPEDALVHAQKHTKFDPTKTDLFANLGKYGFIGGLGATVFGSFQNRAAANELADMFGMDRDVVAGQLGLSVGPGEGGEGGDPTTYDTLPGDTATDADEGAEEEKTRLEATQAIFDELIANAGLVRPGAIEPVQGRVAPPDWLDAARTPLGRAGVGEMRVGSY